MLRPLNITATEITQEAEKDPSFAAYSVEKHIEKLVELNPKLNMMSRNHFESAKLCAQVLGGLLTGNTFIVAELDNQKHAVNPLRDEGALLLGELSYGSDPLCLDCNHSDRTPNPWHFEHVAGGVSGTTAAVVASGGASFSVCADHCGSLIPE